LKDFAPNRSVLSVGGGVIEGEPGVGITYHTVKSSNRRNFAVAASIPAITATVIIF